MTLAGSVHGVASARQARLCGDRVGKIPWLRFVQVVLSDYARFPTVQRMTALSPLDLAIAPNGNVVVSSEHPFGAADAVTRCANTTLRMDTSCGSSLPQSWPSFGNRAVYGLVLTGISTASLRTRSSPSILRMARAWVA
jgi:hypothetical protein